MSGLRRYTSAHIRDRETFHLMMRRSGLTTDGNLAFPREKFQKVPPVRFSPRTKSLFVPDVDNPVYDTYMDRLQRQLPDLEPHGVVPFSSVANY